MGFRLPGIRRPSFTTKVASSRSGEVPKGYLAVYVGEEMKRFVIPMGALTFPCREEVFLNVTSFLNGW
ncbi:hypothetical protein QN277_005828 [Acacia crassicarpa]|uniref:Uncharacterized protein n=1 Tax=Acacia crassicarpa TaxID=499986 RepID=A0AAE1JUC2_9FABA|nr:hypothetical protein QN277_005828 [Acacia crassicarpa]